MAGSGKGNVICLEHHVLTSQRGHKSGRKSDFETPVASSILGANSAGTPRLERVSQYQTCDCVVPIRSASRFWLPADAQARLSASVDDIAAQYPNLGERQPKNIWRRSNRKIGRISGMKPEIDAKAFGRRVRERRKEFCWSQEQLGTETEYSQTNIGWIEQGKAKDPRKQAMALAEALQTTQEWLLFGPGEKNIGPRLLSDAEIKDLYADLPLAERQRISEIFLGIKRPKQRKSA